MGASFATNHQQNLKRLHTHDQLGFDGMSLLFARRELALFFGRTFNRLFGHIHQNSLEILIQQSFLAREPQNIRTFLP